MIRSKNFIPTLKRLLSLGFSYKGIAEAIGVGSATVQRHVKRLGIARPSCLAGRCTERRSQAQHLSQRLAATRRGWACAESVREADVLDTLWGKPPQTLKAIWAAIHGRQATSGRLHSHNRLARAVRDLVRRGALRVAARGPAPSYEIAPGVFPRNYCAPFANPEDESDD